MATSTRIRISTYPARQVFPLRLTVPLYERLTAACQEAPMTTTNYVSTTLALALRKPIDVDELIEFTDSTSEPRVTLTLRLMPSLHESLQAAVQKAGGRSGKVSMNKLIAFVLDRALPS